MGLFGRKTKEEKAVVAPKETVKAAAKKSPASKAKKEKVVKAETAVVTTASTSNPVVIDTTRVIVGPRITEKATMKADSENVFVFEVAQSANKVSVRQAIRAMFNVVPVKVSIARNPSKKVFSRGKRGVVSGVKKAYVYLKEGDKIEIV